MANKQQSEALRLANYLHQHYDLMPTCEPLLAASELRRLHAESEQHLQELAAYRFTVDNLRARVAELEDQLKAAPQAVPFMWAIREPGGGAYMDDGCVSSVREDVEAEVDGLNPGLDADDEPYMVVPVYLAATHPTQQGLDQDKHLGSFGAYANENDLALSPYGWLPKNIEDACAIRTSDGAQEVHKKGVADDVAEQFESLVDEYSTQPNIDMLKMHVAPGELIRAVCASGSSITIKDDCSLFVEDGADLQEAAEAIVSASFQIIKTNSLIFHDLTSVLQLRNSRGAVLSVNIDGDVQASPEWPQDTIEFAKMIGKAMLNRISNTPEKQAIEAMEFALSSHGIQLLSYPPQDAWIARGVSEKLRAAIAALASQAKQGEQANG